MINERKSQLTKFKERKFLLIHCFISKKKEENYLVEI